MMRRLLFWLVWNVPLGRAAPWVMGLALGRMPRRALAAATGTAKTPTAAECEASQSGGDSRNAQPASSPSESK